MDLAALARQRMRAFADPDKYRHDPVAAADNRTSMCDARIALCIALGVPAEDIDPASGYDLSRATYESVRASWRRHVEMHGFSEQYDRPRYEAAFGSWASRRPQFTNGDDWLAGVLKPEPEGTQS
ncbi:hypothetical protein [Actinocrinis sp.]|uniref:hypothetical protein n=1 Tax=Actinocrinis sp. TaxID=1920516 RepID=UPI002D31B3D6|nr:hypothetical protein [Actinocrinis sp.]HZP49650.1 hypothetical protein [Actinocrinis sp.]